MFRAKRKRRREDIWEVYPGYKIMMERRMKQMPMRSGMWM
jgi:hypothetical protein